MRYEFIIKLPSDAAAIGEKALGDAVGALVRGMPLADIGRLAGSPDSPSRSPVPADAGGAPESVRPPSPSEGTGSGAAGSGAQGEPSGAAAQASGSEGERQPLDVQAVMIPLATDDRPLAAVVKADPSAGVFVELSMSFEVRPDRLDDVFRRAVGFAGILKSPLIDPQLSRTVTDGDAESVRAKWTEMREWLLRSDGRSALLEDTNAPLTLPEPTFLERHWKGLGIGLLLVVVFMAIHRIIRLIATPLAG